MEASIKEPNVLQTYEELKSDFEKYACRIDDVLLYPVLDTKNERTLYTLLQLKERFSHLKYLRGKQNTSSSKSGRTTRTRKRLGKWTSYRRTALPTCIIYGKGTT